MASPEPPDGPDGPSVRVRLLVAYRGEQFHGFAEQASVPTVGGAIRSVLEDCTGGPVELTCAGRTDRGVHAWGQVVHYDVAPQRSDPARAMAAINSRLAPMVVVRAAEVAPEGFDARRSARARTYRYTICNAPVPDPFVAETSWFVHDPLDLGLLRLACDPLIGEHDFSSFCRAPKVPEGAAAPSLVRRVADARWTDLGGGMLRFEITASAFCHQMVRSVTGTIVEMGRGKRRPGEMAGVLRSRDRSAAGQLAPPQGLCLWHVDYGEGGFALLPPAA